MAKSTDIQKAQCVKVRTVEIINKRGEVAEKSIGVLSLDGSEFEVWESSHFKAELNKWYFPSIAVYSQPYIDKGGKARARNAVAVNWEPVP